MKVSPLSPATSVAQQEDVSRHDDSDAGSINRLKRRRLHSQTDIMIDGHYPRHRYPRRDDKSPSMDRFDAISNRVDGNSNSSYSSGNSGEEDASDCDDTSTVMADSNVYPDGQSHAQEGTSSPPPPHDKKDNTTIVNNNNTNTEGDCTTPAIRNAVQQLTTNDDNNSEKYKDIETIQTTFEPAISSSPVEHLNESETINEKNQRTTEETFDDPMAVVSTNHCVNSDNSNDGCLSQSPLNLTRSQGSSVEGGNKSEDDDEGEEFEDDSEGKNGFGNVINDNENIVNGINLPTTEVPFPWNMTSDINNKQKQQHRGDKISAQPPQLLLTSGQLTTGCLQAAQLLIPTARGIMTQTILAIPINDMAASAVTAPNANQQQLLQQQLLYHSSNNVRQKNINHRQQLNQNCQPPLPLSINRYFQQNQSAADDTGTVAGGALDSVNNDDTNMLHNDAVAADQYSNVQRKRWHTPDLASKKHNFLTPQQKLLHRAKNGEGGGGGGESINAQRSKESTAVIQTPAGVLMNGDSRIYLSSNNNNNTNNNTASAVTAGVPAPMSPPTQHGRNGNTNGGGADVTQRQAAIWPSAIATIDQHNDNGGDDNDNEEEKHQIQPQPSHVINTIPPTSSTNINALKSLAQPSSQVNSHIIQSKDDDSTSAAAAAAAAAAAYNQQNAICTALATHMLCASQLAAAQQPMFDNMDNGNGAKKPNHSYNNNNNNNVKTNNMMGVVNPAVLEKWMMEERYFYNNNNNNNKNIAGGHAHHQRYNAAAAAAAAAAAVELLSGGVPTSSNGGVGDALASCKKRKRRTSFTPHALELLNGHFERNTHPSGSEITGLAHRLGYEREVIRIWFCNKRQALKNTVRTINGSGPIHMISTKSHNNTSGY